ncbi:MAG TPA: hypothetical protein VKB21_08005 [Candidatus Acidoferrum sp.]|nr:hypothetical protein [Candidatus Acidoferrum sp.]
MPSFDAAKPPLTPAVLELIHANFPPQERAIVHELIQAFHWPPGPAVNERVHLDLLELSAGHLDRLRELVAAAQVNWRDIILAAEYDVVGDQIIQNERGKRRLAELTSRKRKPDH